RSIPDVGNCVWSARRSLPMSNPTIPNHGFRNHLSACCPQWGSYWRRYFVWHVLVESANSGQGPGAGAQAFATRGVIQAFHRKSLNRSEEHTSELQSRGHLVCRLLLEKKKN